MSPGCTRHFLGTVSDTRGILIWFRQAKSLKKQANMNLICSWLKAGKQIKTSQQHILIQRDEGKQEKGWSEEERAFQNRCSFLRVGSKRWAPEGTHRTHRRCEKWPRAWVNYHTCYTSPWSCMSDGEAWERLVCSKSRHAVTREAECHTCWVIGRPITKLNSGTWALRGQPRSRGPTWERATRERGP